MAMDLKHVIEKIRKDGIEEAESAKEALLEEAREEAERVRREAEEEREAVLREAEEGAKRARKNAEEAIAQAARDVQLALREQLVAVFERVVKAEVARGLTSSALKDIIIAIAEKFLAHEGGPVEVLLSEEDKEKLSGSLLAALKKKLDEGVELKADSKLEKGFRIGRKDSHAFYDFSEEAISEAFCNYLSPQIRELLRAKDKDAQ